MLKERTKYEMALIDKVLRSQTKPIQIKKIAEITGLSQATVSKVWWKMFQQMNAPILKDEDGIYYTKEFSLGFDDFIYSFEAKEKQKEKEREKKEPTTKIYKFKEKDRMELIRNIATAETIAERERHKNEIKQQSGRWILRMRTETNKYFIGNAKRGYPIVSTDRKKAFVFTDLNDVKRAKAMLYGQFEEVTE